jgi:hypothetical protein
MGGSEQRFGGLLYQCVPQSHFLLSLSPSAVTVHGLCARNTSRQFVPLRQSQTHCFEKTVASCSSALEDFNQGLLLHRRPREL